MLSVAQSSFEGVASAPDHGRAEVCLKASATPSDVQSAYLADTLTPASSVPRHKAARSSCSHLEASNDAPDCVGSARAELAADCLAGSLALRHEAAADSLQQAAHYLPNPNGQAAAKALACGLGLDALGRAVGKEDAGRILKVAARAHGEVQDLVEGSMLTCSRCAGLTAEKQ